MDGPHMQSPHPPPPRTYFYNILQHDISLKLVFDTSRTEIRKQILKVLSKSGSLALNILLEDM